MKPWNPTLLLASLIAVAVPTAAWADEDEDEGGAEEGGEEEGEESEESESEAEARAEEEERADRARAQAEAKKRRRAPREVIKGFYGKANIGAIIWVPPISNYTSTVGTEIHVSLGYDIIDKLNFTLSLQGTFFQLVTNGDGSFGGIASPIQGDFRIFGGVAALRLGPNFGGKKVKRANLAIQIGGGVGASPLLVPKEGTNYATGASIYGGLMQDGAVGIITPGIGVEYYTKLSHFSVGLDLTGDIFIGSNSQIAVGIGITGALKYTF